MNTPPTSFTLTDRDRAMIEALRSRWKEKFSSNVVRRALESAVESEGLTPADLDAAGRSLRRRAPFPPRRPPGEIAPPGSI